MTGINIPFSHERIFIDKRMHKDYVHEHHTNSNVINKQDQLRLTGVSNPLEQGQQAHKNWGTRSHFDGIRVWDYSNRGNRKATHKTVQRHTTIHIK